MFVVQGRRSLAWFLGFWEILIWVTVVSKVIQNLSEPLYAISFALGFATGSAVGITLERWLAFGDQVIRVFAKEGPRIDVTLYIRKIDPNCFYTIDDVQMVSQPALILHRPTGWRAVMKKK